MGKKIIKILIKHCTFYRFIKGVHTELANEVEFLAAIFCGFPLKASTSQDKSTGCLCLWQVNPVTVADI